MDGVGSDGRLRWFASHHSLQGAGQPGAGDLFGSYQDMAGVCNLGVIASCIDRHAICGFEVQSIYDPFSRCLPSGVYSLTAAGRLAADTATARPAIARILLNARMFRKKRQGG